MNRDRLRNSRLNDRIEACPIALAPALQIFAGQGMSQISFLMPQKSKSTIQTIATHRIGEMREKSKMTDTTAAELMRRLLDAR